MAWSTLRVGHWTQSEPKSESDASIIQEYKYNSPATTSGRSVFTDPQSQQRDKEVEGRRVTAAGAKRGTTTATARRGTLLFPDLGAQCDEAECNQLDFLQFECDGCGGSFCAAHRTYRDHGCAKAADEGRTVVVCPDCGDSVERAAAAPGRQQTEREILEAHTRSGRCDPARKCRPQCPKKGCKEALTFCNATQCKGCALKVCLRHRFPADHDCCAAAATSARAAAGAAAARRAAAGGQCGRDAQKNKEGSRRPPLAVSVKSFKIC